MLNRVNNFKYAGVIITLDERCLTEIKCSISQAKDEFQKIKSMLCNNPLSINVRKGVLIEIYIEPALLYML